MSLVLLLPVKPFAAAKSRLAGALAADQRAALAQALLARTLALALAADTFATVAVISRDPAVHACAERSDVLWLAEQGDDLNAALAQGRTWAMQRKASGLLLLPADLPTLTVADLRELVRTANSGADVVISPSRDGGTNALYLALDMPAARHLPLLFGPGSFTRHLAAAHAAGLRVAVCRSPSLAFDLDWPTELGELNLGELNLGELNLELLGMAGPGLPAPDLAACGSGVEDCPQPC